MSYYEIRPIDRSCGSYGPGHQIHWIQAKKSWEDEQPMIDVSILVHRDGRVDLEGDELNLTMWNHDPDHLRSALCFGGRAEWKPKYHVLYVISSGSFNLTTLDKVEPCKPPIRRETTETTRQFIQRAMRENNGYTVPARWLADLDAIPDGVPVNRSLGTWLGLKLLRIQRCWSHCPQTTDARKRGRRHALQG